MKKVLMALICVLMLAGPVLAEDRITNKLGWDPSQGATGYIIYGVNAETGLTQQNPMIQQDAGNNSVYPLAPLNSPPGVKFNFAVSAYNAAGESGLSNIVSWTRPAFTPPQNIVLPPIQGPAKVTISIIVE